jgi:hypothetical protein
MYAAPMRRWVVAVGLLACHSPKPPVVPDAFLHEGPSVQVNLDELGSAPRRVMRYGWLATPHTITIVHAGTTEHGQLTATARAPNRIDITLDHAHAGFTSSAYALVPDEASPLASVLPRSWPDSAIGPGARWRVVGSDMVWELTRFDGPRAELHGHVEGTDVTVTIDVAAMHIDSTATDASGTTVLTVR